MNAELRKLSDWLLPNKLTLITQKIELYFIPPPPEESDVQRIPPNYIFYISLITRKVTMQDLNQKIILNILAFYLIDIFPGNSISITMFCCAELYSSKRSETKKNVKRDDKVITKPDKGSCVVVMDKEGYLRLLSESSINDATRFRHFLSTSNVLFTNSNVTCAMLVMLVTHLATYTRKTLKNFQNHLYGEQVLTFDKCQTCSASCFVFEQIIRFVCFKAMSLVMLAHSLLSKRVSFWFSEVCMILGQLQSAFHLIVCGKFLSLFALGSLGSIFPSCLPPKPIAGIDGFLTYLGNEVAFSRPGSSVFDSPASVIPWSSAELITDNCFSHCFIRGDSSGWMMGLICMQSACPALHSVSLDGIFLIGVQSVPSCLAFA